MYGNRINKHVPWHVDMRSAITPCSALLRSLLIHMHASCSWRGFSWPMCTCLQAPPVNYSSKKSILVSGAPTVVSNFPNSVVTFVKGPFWEWLLSRWVKWVESRDMNGEEFGGLQESGGVKEAAEIVKCVERARCGRLVGTIYCFLYVFCYMCLCFWSVFQDWWWCHVLSTAQVHTVSPTT